MNEIQWGIIALIKSAVTGEKEALPEDFELEKAIPLIKAHHIVPLVYEGALRCGIDQTKEVMQQMFQYYCRAAQINKRQTQMLNKVFSAFDEHDIDYMPVKGCIIKKLYQKPEHRMMGDADVLIRMEQYEKIVTIVQKMGFHWTSESDSHYVWESDALKIELHKSLFTEDQGMLASFFSDGWSFAKTRDKGCHSMTPEDTYVYLFAHFAKHYLLGGVGLRQLVDLWVFKRTHPNMNEVYIQTAMEHLHLGKFHQNIYRTISWWFEDGEADDVTQMIAKIIFANGSWGSIGTYVIAQGAHDAHGSSPLLDGRFAYIRRRVFPGMKNMRMRYPILKKTPYLVPVVWVYHLVSRALSATGGAKQQIRNLSVLTKDNVDKQRKLLEAVGLESYL